MLRLLADDLTGALDSVAPFAAGRRPVSVTWGESDATGGDLGLDSETRDLDAVAAIARVKRLAPLLEGAAIPFKKIDSVLRGHPGAELAACLRAGDFATAIVAPAFPAQGRITRGGRQLVRCGEVWRDAEVDLAADLKAAGVCVAGGFANAHRGARQVVFCDAATDDDLASIVHAGRQLAGPVLWCGSAGLARALAGDIAAETVETVLRTPLAVVAGTRHPLTVRQLASLPVDAGIRICRVGEQGPPSLDQIVDEALDGPAPATAIVTGGATLHRLMVRAGASRLDVRGEVMPGLPVAQVRGGIWDGVTIVSKSGGFGAPWLLATLLREAGLG